jgi:predicted  nucleic acid-binding Zn-ribbon protein
VSRTLQLYQLQSLDSDIDKAKQELAEIAAKLGESETLTGARALAKSSEGRLRRARTVMQDLDLEVRSLAAKIESEEKKLYSGRVLNAKEAANLQEEVASLKRRHENREEHLLEAMVEVEETEQAFAEAGTQLATIEAEWSAGQDQLRQEQAVITKRLAELEARRPAMTAPVSQADLREYENLRAKKGGRAVVSVKDSVCQGCGMIASSSQLQRARAGAELIYCTACGRIFYLP